MTTLSNVFFKTIFSASLVLVFAFTVTPVLAAERSPNAAQGKTLHEKSCMKCHDNRQYTRPNRIIHTFEDLRARVEFCDNAAKAGFSADELDDVVEYLNVNFYKFKK